jgi:hypothetical protein
MQIEIFAPAFAIGNCEITNEIFDVVGPHSFVTVREIVCVPTEENEIDPGFSNVELEGVPPPKVQE